MGPRRTQRPLDAFKPGDVVKGVVRRHHIDHGILVDVNGLWDGCAPQRTHLRADMQLLF